MLTRSNFIVVAGYGQYLVDGTDLGDLTIPVVEIALLESAKIRTLKMSNIANITMLPNGKLYSLQLVVKREISHINLRRARKPLASCLRVGLDVRMAK